LQSIEAKFNELARLYTTLGDFQGSDEKEQMTNIIPSLYSDCINMANQSA
jgi:hypothetical protein